MSEPLLEILKSTEEAFEQSFQSGPDDLLYSLIVRAVKTALLGNYAIAAAVVIPIDDSELIVFGENSIVSDQNAMGHAEIGAIEGMQRLLLNLHQGGNTLPWEDGSPTSLAHSSFTREGNPSINRNIHLVTTLEPCPMCTVALLNFGIQEVSAILPDIAAGSILDGRLARLGPVWGRFAHTRGLSSRLISSKLPPHLIEALTDAFDWSRSPIDQWLASEGVLSLIESYALPPPSGKVAQ